MYALVRTLVVQIFRRWSVAIKTNSSSIGFGSDSLIVWWCVPVDHTQTHTLTALKIAFFPFQRCIWILSVRLFFVFSRFSLWISRSRGARVISYFFSSPICCGVHKQSVVNSKRANRYCSNFNCNRLLVSQIYCNNFRCVCLWKWTLNARLMSGFSVMHFMHLLWNNCFLLVRIELREKK